MGVKTDGYGGRSGGYNKRTISQRAGRLVGP